MESLPLSSRRKFISTSLALGGVALSLRSEASDRKVEPGVTVGQIIEAITRDVPQINRNGTVDTLKTGNADQQVTGIVTTMFATMEVIKKTIDAGANFIIAHEPTFYNHSDDTSWLEDHHVYRQKRQLLDKNNVAVWRLHDYIHAFKADGILMGVLKSLDWEKFYNTDSPTLLKMPAMKLRDVINHVKKKLNIERIRYVGDLGQPCERIALMPGAWGGRMQISALQSQDPDVLICGEVSEWETSEYVRDSQQTQRKQSLIVLGHAMSEEPGMQWFKEWLQPKYPDMKIHHFSSQSPFSWG